MSYLARGSFFPRQRLNLKPRQSRKRKTALPERSSLKRMQQKRQPVKQKPRPRKQPRKQSQTVSRQSRIRKMQSAELNWQHR